MNLYLQIEIWIESKIHSLQDYKLEDFQIFLHTEKMFNKVKVQDNFESLLIGLLNDSERRDELNEQN